MLLAVIILNLDFNARYVCMVVRLIRKWNVVKNFTGAERLAFGTDYPVAYAESELERFFALGLNEQERKAILYDNAARFLGL